MRTVNYVRGDRLPANLQREVLARFVHRWTHENARQTYGGKCPGCEQSIRFGTIRTGLGTEASPWKDYTIAQWHAYHKPLVTDAEWLREHAFVVTTRGTLDARHRFAHSAIFADNAAFDAGVRSVLG